MNEKEGILNYKENIINILLITSIFLNSVYIILFIIFKSLFPLLFTVAFLIIYIVLYFLCKKISLNKIIFLLLFISILHIFIASLFILEKEIALYYLFFPYAPIIHISLGNKYRFRKILLSSFSILLILFFEFIPHPVKIVYFEWYITKILRTITILGVCMQLVVPVSMFSIQIRSNESFFYQKSIIDPLTGLYNRNYLYNLLKIFHETSKRYKHTYIIMLIDIDYFKKINDTYGHIFGDKILISLGELIKNNIRNSDSAFRYGGEEFLILLPESKIEKGIKLAERIKSNLKQMKTHKKDLSVTVSIGIAQGPGDKNEVEIVKKADEMLYKAKNNGRNRIEF